MVQSEQPSAARGELTVAVCTRNRPQDLRECVASVLANPERDFSLLVVDQSDDGGDALAAFAGDPRLNYHRTALRGLSRSRNEVLSLARSRVVAFTDDDCRVAPDFVHKVRAYLAREPEVALAFGRVVAPPELHAQGFVATFEPEEQRYSGVLPPARTPWGIGANMLLDRRRALEVGAFDPRLGAGAALPAGEELDFTMRLLGAGLTMTHTPAFEVTHLGVRTWEFARAQFSTYAAGAGAAYVKNVRLGTPGATAAFASWLLKEGVGALGNAISGRRPTGLGMVRDTLAGGLRVSRLPLDRARRSFRDGSGG